MTAAVTTTTSATVQKDAQNRALRTLLQGFLIDLLIALAITAHGILTSTEFSWAVLGLAIAKTLLTTATSYVMRLKMGSMLIEPNKPDEPVTVMVGGYSLELQRPGHADHAERG